jgi:transcriptional regulator with XRE-family HTH domain
MYEQRLRRNLRPILEEHGIRLTHAGRQLESVGARHIWNIERGLATMTVKMLESIADEIGADMLEFFRE